MPDWIGDERRGDTTRPLERHVQTILTALILAAIAYVGSTLKSLENKFIRYEERAIAESRISNQQSERIEQHDNQIRDIQLRLDRVERMNVPSAL